MTKRFFTERLCATYKMFRFFSVVSSCMTFGGRVARL